MNRLMRLLIDNRAVQSAARRFEIQNADAAEATVYLYDFIVSSALDAEWMGGVAAEAFVKEFAAITAPVIHLRVNSPGGDVFAARAMEQAIRQHQSKVIVHVDGYAASAATYIALAGDEIEIADGGFFMVHQSWTWAMGNATDLDKTAQLLRQIDDTIVRTYAKRTSLDEAQLRDMLAAETWIGAEDAVRMGFADRIASDAPKDQVGWNVAALREAATPANVARPRDLNVESDTEAEVVCPACSTPLSLSTKVTVELLTVTADATEDPTEEAMGGPADRAAALRRLNHYERIAA